MNGETGAKVLITGGARGIGLAVAKKIVSHGERVVIWDMDSAALDKALDELGALSEGNVVDVSDEAAINLACSNLKPTHLVNNAGIMDRNTALDAMTTAEIDRVFAINVRGALLVTAAFLRTRADHPTASVVNMTSIAGQNGGAKGHAIYGATKGALISLTAAMSRDLAPDIRVNGVAPGIIDTDIQTKLFADRNALEQTTSTIPLGRLGQSGEVAEVVDWLLFEASYVSGEIIRVSGGRK